jgi:ketosteroid isomerase-like protein
MGPLHQTRSAWRSLLLITTVLLAIVPFAWAHENLLPNTDNLDAAAAITDVRVVTPAADAVSEQELRSADRALIQAVATDDRLAAARLLDPEFTWIDRDGRSRSKPDLVNRIILLSAGPDANVTLQNYGRVVLVTGTHRLTPDNALAFFARAWVRQASGWHLLLYQETAAPEVTVKGVRYEGTQAGWPALCDNPCRSLPYKPLSSEAQEIVDSFMAGQEAVFEGDAETASHILSDDVLFVTADRAQPMDKAQRLAALHALRRAGQIDPPPAVVSMALWVFGNSAVMYADQESPSGGMLRATRVWIKRDARWQLTFSQQTFVQ